MEISTQEVQVATKVTKCTCPPLCDLWSADPDCPRCGPDVRAEQERQAQAEIEAENAWLRYAERSTDEDYAFERYESELGLGLGELDGGGQ